MTGYTRNDTGNNIADGNIINASDLDGEFDAIQSAFDAASGHTHDGTTGEGAPIEVLGPTQDVVITSAALRPKTDDTVDLGTPSLEFKNLYLDGTANIDNLVADAGTVGGVAITTASNTQTLTNKTLNLASNTLVATSAQLAAAITDETGTGSVVFSGSPALTGTPTAPTAVAGTNTTQVATTAHVFAERTNTATLTNKTLTSPTLNTANINTPDIDGGTIDGTVIGGSTPAAISGTTITGTSFVSSGDMTFGDNDKAIFGAGSDLQIYHDGDNSFIHDVGVGSLILRATNFRLFNSDQTKVSILANDGSNTSLYYDGSPKLSTTATGVDVTGTITSDGLTVDGVARIQGAATGLVINENDTVDLNTYLNSNNGDFRVLTVNDAFTLFKERINVDHTTGDISFYEDTGTTPKFFWDASAEALGIGTVSPSDLLDISANGTSVVRLSDSSAPATYAQITQANGVLTFAADAGNAQTGSNIQFEVDGTERMRIDSSGNVGIGTSSVSNPNSYGAILNVKGYAPALVLSEDTGRDYTIGVNGNNLNIFNETTNVLTIADSGNVGIGTSSPARTLSVNGIAGFGNGTIETIISFSDRGIIGTQSNHALELRTNGTERMRITSTGSVGIGTSSPTNLLDVNADSIRVRTAQTPASASATGNQGEIAWDADYIYVCVATDTWKRVAIATW